MNNQIAGKKLIGWGTSALLHSYLKAHAGDHGLSYVVDSFATQPSKFESLPLLPPSELQKEDLTKTCVVIFSINNQSRRAIGLALNALGLRYGHGYIDSADLFRNDFEKKAAPLIGKPLSPYNYSLARSHYNNSHVQCQTTVSGNWLLLECLQDSAHLGGSIAEVGAYRGGNAVLMLQAMAANKDSRKYFIMDSYEGFPPLHDNDPKQNQNLYNQEYNFPEIQDRFAMFENCKVIRGFVPDTFVELPKNEKYSMVFFDCDLYAPAVATLDYFWDLIPRGGYMVLHDYVHVSYGGVTKAVDEWTAKNGLKPHVFFESTTAAFKKA